MYVKARETFATPEQSYRRDNLYDIEVEAAEPLLRCRYVEPSDTPPLHVVNFLARLKDGSREPVIFTPFIGEFGHEILTHIRLVHFHEAAHKVVCCRPGNESLYPSADEYITDWTDPLTDEQRIASVRHTVPDWSDLIARYPSHHVFTAGNLSPVEELIAIRPAERIPFRPKRRGLKVDVTLGVRVRQYAPERNWPHWQQVADALTAEGLSFAVIGQHETSHELDGQTHHSGDHDTDAAIELLQGCRLYVGQDSGNSHLAATIGSPMVVFRESRSGSRNLLPRMRQVNSDIAQVEGWDDPAAVITAILRRLT